MKDFEPYIIVFCCHNSLQNEVMDAEYAKPLDFSSDNVERMGYPSNVKVIEMPCGGKTEVIYLMKAFESGADGVCVITCPEGECHFLEGNLRAKGRVKHTQKLLEEISIESDRLQIYQLSKPGKHVCFASVSKKNDEFMRVVNEMIERIKYIGKSPIRGKEARGLRG